jgi:hypothetical protein
MVKAIFNLINMCMIYSNKLGKPIEDWIINTNKNNNIDSS